MNVFGVLVSYYPKYAHNSLTRFEHLLKQLTNSPQIIIACSAQSPLAQQPNALVYSNDHWEFSGWQEGLEALKKQHNVQKDDLIVFANDTFCMHRHFGKIDEWAFVRALRAAWTTKGHAITGELCTWRDNISLPGLQGKQWISTYLFAMRYQTLQLLDSMHFSAAEISEIILELNDEHIKFCPQIDPAFTRYINGWLFPTEPGKGWPKSRQASVDIKFGKIKAILNEKRLSLLLHQKGAQFISVYSGIFGTYRLWRERWFKLKSFKLRTQKNRSRNLKCVN
jgi:hypothetical protein